MEEPLDADDATEAPSRWEYLVISLPPFGPAMTERGRSSAVDTLDAEGARGWEAVGMTPLPDGGTAVLLKRPTSR